MVLSERLGNKARTTAQRTLIYVAAFGLGALFLSFGLSWAVVGMAEGVLPAAAGSGAPKDGKDAKDGAAASAGARLPGPGAGGPALGNSPRSMPKTPGSKAGAARGNEGPPVGGD